MAATETQNSGLDAKERAQLFERLTDARARAVTWLSDRIADDGRPAGADTTNSWWRVPWSLSIGGGADAAAALLGWVEREALTDEGDLRDGPFYPGFGASSVYYVSPIAIASWLLGHYDTATAVMDRLQYWTDPTTGGAYDLRDFKSDPIQDTLMTAQLGVSALVTGRRSVADGVFHWLQSSYEQQPELPNRLYTSMRNGKVVIEFPAEQALSRVLDFHAPRQLYFHPGIAGAFLAGYYQQTGDNAALKLGQDYLQLTKDGTDAQFDDLTSVQISKFAWGTAAMHVAAPESGQLPWVIKMAEWLLGRQKADGSWAPSAWMVPEPGELDCFWKTSEHLLMLTQLHLALASTTAADRGGL